MLRSFRPRAVTVLLLSVVGLSVASAQILNSERIEQTFGSYGIDVLHSDETLRLSNLYSIHDGTKIPRTFAVVEYPQTVDEAFVTEHQKILEGGSIGATFRDAGWEVSKTNISFGEYPVTENGQKLADFMGLELGVTVATHAYRLDVSRARERHEYALIVEMHHPDYLDQESVKRIYQQGSTVEFSPDIRRTADPSVFAGRVAMYRGLQKLRELDLPLSQ